VPPLYLRSSLAQRGLEWDTPPYRFKRSIEIRRIRQLQTVFWESLKQFCTKFALQASKAYSVVSGGSMQRWIAISVVVLLALPVLLPLVSSDAEAHLPPCCRRDGRHHCAMMDALRQSAGYGFHLKSPRCQSWPTSTVTPQHHDTFVLSAALFYAGVVSDPSHFAQVTAAYIASRSRTHLKRGPPHSSL
jgi:hypothetical protein